MSMTPCGDQTQLSSLVSLTRRYLPSAISCRHSTREKLMRHWSPSLGGTSRPVSSFKPFHGQAISTVHPRSVSAGEVNQPSINIHQHMPRLSLDLHARPPSFFVLY